LDSQRCVAALALLAPEEMVVDESFDRSLGETVTVTVTVGPGSFTVVGTTSRSTVLAGQGLVFVDLTSAPGGVFQNTEVVSGFVVNGTADARVADVVILSANDVVDDALGPIESAVASIDLIRILLWFVAAIVMGAVIYLTALGRERDFAALKAVGASLGGGFSVLAIMVALIASFFGTIAAELIEPVFPLPVSIPGSAPVPVPVGLVSAILGVRKANRTDSAEAFG
jgi:putative ABC transport system permease protein